MFSFLKRDKPQEQELQPQQEGGWAARLRQGLSATRARLSQQLSSLFTAGRAIDEALERPGPTLEIWELNGPGS